MYQQVNLSDHTPVGSPGPLPPNLVNLPDSAVADISAACSPPPPGMAGQGWWPVSLVTPSYNACAQTPDGTYAYSVNVSARTVTGTANLRTATAAETAAAQSALIAYANEKQWALATGGYTTTVAGTSIAFPTDVDSLSLIAGTAQALQQPNGPASTNWQAGPSTIVQFKAADFIPAALKVSAFVDATFGALAPIFSAIASGQITTTAQIDAASWPAASG